MKTILHYAAILALFTFAFLTSCSPEDSREKLLNSDMDAIKDKSIAQDSIVNNLKGIFAIMANAETKPENFNFLIKENKDKTKLLILIRIPKLHQIRKEDWPAIVDWTSKEMDSYTQYSSHEKYYGLMGDNFLNGVKTSSYSKFEKLTSKTPLLEFYGEAASTDSTSSN